MGIWVIVQLLYITVKNTNRCTTARLTINKGYKNKSEIRCQSYMNWQTHLYKSRFLTAVCTNCNWAILTVSLQDTQTVIATYLFQIPVTCFHLTTIIIQFLSYILRSLIMNTVAVDMCRSVLPDIGYRTETCSRNFILYILMYLRCILYSLLPIPTNARNIYIYMNNI
jgi:hypothetical protein